MISAAGLKALFGKNFVRFFLAVLWSSFTMWFFAYILTHTIPVENRRIIDHLSGLLEGVIIAGIFNFYYGSSQSSVDKDEHIRNITPAPSQSATITTTVSETKGESAGN